ncbi:MAG: anthranilate synthase component I [Fimbriimonadaceae bacterium]
MIQPPLAEFLAEAESGKSSPLWLEMLADFETPLSAYWKLANEEKMSFLLESVTGGESLARYSVLGVRPTSYLRSKGDDVWLDGNHARLTEGQTPLDILKGLIKPSNHPEGMPKFFGGAVGMLGYDLVRFFEKLPDDLRDDLGANDLAMMICDCVVVFDHAKNLVRIIYNASATAEGYRAGVAEIERIQARLSEPLPELPTGQFEVHPVTSNMDQATFEVGVGRIKDYVAAGDGIQMVLSQRFSTRVDAHPLTVYRALRSLNPSPYMFLVRLDDCDLVGASPEILVSLDDAKANVRPIAGTRWRGRTIAEDEELSRELLADEKERAEHLMLVDLGRNDLGRVCEVGSVQVDELMVIEKYSHVMHIVSRVSGTLSADLDACDLIAATFPAGTVSGAPKVRAMEIIEELEPNRRGAYAGSVGYISNTGDTDLCITIRTIFIKNGIAHVQAGAGIVYDSVPTTEYEETKNKARACLLAIERAQRGL